MKTLTTQQKIHQEKYTQKTNRTIAVLRSTTLRSYLTIFLFSLVLSSLTLVHNVSARPAQVLTGGYPTPQDYERLQLYEVKTIVTFLDPRLPEEAMLLTSEQKLAKLYGMELIQLPIVATIAGETSVAYQIAVTDASDRIAELEGVVYVHCYYGAGRTMSVADRLIRDGVELKSYVIDERTGEAEKLREAELAYDRGDMENAVALLDELPLLDHRLQLMLGWSLYRSKEHGRAMQVFEKLVDRVPELTEARTGLGFASLALGNMSEAEAAFRVVLNQNSDDADANMGMGLVKISQSHFADAERHLNICVQKSPNNVEAQSLLASVSGKLSNQ